MAVPRSVDLRNGQSVDAWQNRHANLITEQGEKLPFIDNSAQRILATKLAAFAERARVERRQQRSLIIKPRRAGFTSKLLARLVIRACTEFRRRFLYVNINEKKCKEAIRDIGRPVCEHLPAYARPTLRNAEALLELAFVETESRVLTEVASVAGAGRGGGYSEGLWDEPPRIKERMPTLDDQLRYLRGALLPAFKHGPFHMLFTPDGVSDITYFLWHESKRGGNDWDRVLITHWECDDTLITDLTTEQFEEIRDTLTDEETHLLDLNGTQGSERIWRIAWRRRQMRESGKEFPQEYPEDDVSCWIAPGTTLFEADDLTHQAQVARAPIAAGSDLAGQDDKWAPRRDGQILYYLPPSPDHEYLVVTDFGVGRGTGDPSMSLVGDLDTGEIVAEFYGFYDPRLFTRLTIEHLCRPYEEALWAPESNVGPGRGMPEYAMQDLEYVRLYRHVRWEGVKPVWANEWGWPTDPGTRPKMLDCAYDALRDRSVQVNSERVLADLQAFKLRQRHGRADRYEAEPGAHDEGAVCLGMFTYIRERGQVRIGIG